MSNNVTMHIKVKTQFEGFHCWENAPAEVAFLRNVHRHMFHVEMMLDVDHADRDQEFFLVKRKLDSFIGRKGFHGPHTLSCEYMAGLIQTEFKARLVIVSEDGDNEGIALMHGPPAKEVELPKTVKSLFAGMKAINTNDPGKKAYDATLIDLPTTNPHLEMDLPAEPSLPALQKRTKCFYGTEAEGPHRGVGVFFIPHGVLSADVLKAFNKIRSMSNWKIERIYYGAGNCRAKSSLTLSDLIQKRLMVGNTPLPLDIECQSFADIELEFKSVSPGRMKALDINIISNDQKDNENPKVSFVKRIHTFIEWETNGISPNRYVQDAFYTAIDDERFAQDVEIEI